MKIYSIEVTTETGRRVVQLAVPLDIDPSGAMPVPFRALTEVLWAVVCEVAEKASSLTPPKVEA